MTGSSPLLAPIGKLVSALMNAANQGTKMSSLPFADAPELVPHTAKTGFAWSHIGVMIPNLPEPLRFLSMTTINGAPTAPIAEILHRDLPPNGPRDRATVNVSTAATAPGFWGDYRISEDCTLARDGSEWRFGEDVSVVGNYPSFRLTSKTDNLTIDLELECTDVVTWFVHLPVYKHLSLLTRYSGSIAHEGVNHQVSGLCTFEVAVGASPYSIPGSRLPGWMKLPLEFFTYQVVDLGDDLQLLFVATEALGADLLNSAYLRHIDGRSVALDKGVVFEVLEHQTAITPDGFEMKLPRRFRWTTPVDSVLPVEIEGTVDAPFCWGLGNGYVGGYSFTGTVEGRPVEGRTGYIEYIDRRS